MFVEKFFVLLLRLADGLYIVGLSLSFNSEPGFTRKSSELILIFDLPVM